MEATFYGMRISHPAYSAELMLARKGIEAERVEISPGTQRILMRGHGFKGGTVPGLKVGGRKVQGSREIARALDELVPEPPLYPADAEGRKEVEAAELWGDEMWQPVPRRIFRWTITKDGDLRSYLARRMPVPKVSSTLLLPVALVYVRYEGGGAKAVERDLAAIPSHLDRIDSLIEAGTLNGPELNAADFQIGPTTRVLMNFPQLKPYVEGRPAAEHAMRVAGEFGRPMPVNVPAEWLPA
jgi:glutathione S-transferase